MKAAIFASILSTTAFANEPLAKERIRSHIQTLASPEFAGRAPLTVGEAKTLDYLEREFRKVDLVPLPGFKSFRLPVPLLSIATSLASPVRFGNVELQRGRDITILSSMPKAELAFENAAVVFVGFGIHNEEFQWNDFARLDVKDKILLIWVNDPGFRDIGLFRGKAMTYSGRWIYKLEEARRQGARGAFIVHETEAAGYGWQVVAGAESHYILPPKAEDNPPLAVHGWIHEDSVRRIFAAQGLDYDAVKSRPLEAGKAFSVLDKAPLRLSIRNKIEEGVSHNMCGMHPPARINGMPDGMTSRHPQAARPSAIPSSQTPAILISAHWDHLGQRKAADGSTATYAGAIDNASGVAALLELARKLRGPKALENAAIYCSFTAEEQGLLGAAHFVAEQTYPLSAILAMLNLDSLNVGEINPNIVLSGGSDGGLSDILTASAKKLGRTVVADPLPEKGYFFRSDHHPFVQAGIKALNFLDIGFSDPKYLSSHYHQPSDIFNPAWTLNGFLADLELFADLAHAIDKNIVE